MELTKIIKNFLLISILLTKPFDNVPNIVLGVEQKIIIDLGTNRNNRNEENFYNNYNNRNYESIGARTNFEGRNGIDVYKTKKNSYIQGLSSAYSSPFFSTHNENTKFELKNLIIRLERLFLDQVGSLAKRIDRLEANQNSFRRTVMSEWQALSNVDSKRIRLFTSTLSTWYEAMHICEANTGKLLQIESAEENNQLLDLLRNASSTSNEALFWINTQTTLAFNFPPGKFTNFNTTKIHKLQLNSSAVEDDGITDAQNDTSAEQFEDEEENLSTKQASKTNGQFERGCAAISMAHGGKWMNRNCLERHLFICQL